MEDALVLVFISLYSFTALFVLILVLMEDALVHLLTSLLEVMLVSLNPCFNGRCTSTPEEGSQVWRLCSCLNPCFNGRCTSTAGIMSCISCSKGLNPCFNGRCTSTLGINVPEINCYDVLILVLMEDALVLFNTISL